MGQFLNNFYFISYFLRILQQVDCCIIMMVNDCVVGEKYEKSYPTIVSVTNSEKIIPKHYIHETYDLQHIYV